MSEWKPINTAPFEYVPLTDKEGTMWLEWCLLFIPDGYGGLPIVGGMDADQWLGRNDDRSCFELETDPTHWMPLPNPPRVTQTEEHHERDRGLFRSPTPSHSIEGE